MSDPDAHRAPSVARSRLFVALVVLLGLAGVEMGARIVEAVQKQLVPPAHGETAFAVLANPAPAFERVDEGDGAFYARTKAHWLPRRERFAASKPDGGLRIFALGGSAALGWPHSDAGSYAHDLARLEEALRGVPLAPEPVEHALRTYHVSLGAGAEVDPSAWIETILDLQPRKSDT